MIVASADPESAGRPEVAAATDHTGRRSVRVALAHDWLTGMRGGEKVLEVFCDLFPDAEIFTLVHVPGSVSAAIERHRIRRSALAGLPAIRRYYRQYLPVFPAAVELFDLDRFDLVISTSHCVVKSVVRPGRARHLCYCHTPMRYAWDQFDAYFGPKAVGRAASRLMRRAMAGLARWDRDTAARVDRFVANSRHVATRIHRYYNRAARVVYPPVDTQFFHPDGSEPGDACLVVSALVPYKRIDLAIEACARVGRPLQIVGQGPELAALRRLAGPTVTFLGVRSDSEIRDLYRRAAAVLLPGEEDFGIVPVEAQACGRPVVAVARGGALETVVDGVNGVLVEPDSAEALAAGIDRGTRHRFDPARIREGALRFARDRFAATMRDVIDDLLSTDEGAR